MAEPEQVPTHEPKNSKFKQQALPAWQPILTAGTVLPTFFVIGVAFIPIGVGLMYFSDTVKEVSRSTQTAIWAVMQTRCARM